MISARFLIYIFENLPDEALNVALSYKIISCSMGVV